MAKESASLCPEKLTYVGGDARKASLKQIESANFERTPVLDPTYHWLAIPQEHFSVTMDITGVGKRTSHRFWFVGFTPEGKLGVNPVRSIAVSSLRAMAFALVQDGKDAPKVGAALNEAGNTRAAAGTSYIHAMEDTSWIGGDKEKQLFYVKEPVAIQAMGSAEVYQAEFKDGQMQRDDAGNIALETRVMKFFKRTDAPSAEMIEIARKAIEDSGVEFYAL